MVVAPPFAHPWPRPCGACSPLPPPDTWSAGRLSRLSHPAIPATTVHEFEASCLSPSSNSSFSSNFFTSPTKAVLAFCSLSRSVLMRSRSFNADWTAKFLADSYTSWVLRASAFLAWASNSADSAILCCAAANMDPRIREDVEPPQGSGLNIFRV